MSLFYDIVPRIASEEEMEVARKSGKVVITVDYADGGSSFVKLTGYVFEGRIYLDKFEA